MTKVAIYARYSSDMQSDASIEDQIRITDEKAEKEGWDIVNHYTDHGISGASMMRPGIQMLMQDAAAGKFDILLAEALDRLSRDQEDIAGIYKRLQFAGIKIITLSEGEISNLHIGLKGTMNALFLKDLASKVRRGQRGRIEKGKSGGGITYGYDVVKKIGADGEPVRGEREINQEQARIVERIFKDYIAGKSPKAIAKELNQEGVAGPTGKGWTQSTINGNRQRGTGILNNELYIGKMVWNRLRYIKDPDTGKRVSRMNPENEWVVHDTPEMRIIDQDMWDKAKARQSTMEKKGGNFRKMKRPKYLLSYLLKCGCCGGGYGKVSSKHYGCSTARNKGTCDNKTTIKQDDLEHSVLHALQSYLMDPELCEVFCKEYTKYMNELRIQHNAQKHAYEAEFKKLQKDDAKMVQAICDGFATPELKVRMDENVARQKELQVLLGDFEEAPPLLHPSMGFVLPK